MNSLSDLNNFSSTIISFNDTRPPEFKYSSDGNITITSYPGVSHYIIPKYDLETITNVGFDLRYSINVAAMPGTTISWPPLSGKGTGNLVANVSNGVYTVYGIKTVSDWTIVNRPNIQLAANATSTTFNSNIFIGNSSVLHWTSNVDILSLEQLTSVAGSTYYDAGENKVIANPLLFDLDDNRINPLTYSVLVTTSNTSAIGNLHTVSSQGGSSSYNSGTGVLTITGSINAVNDRLNNLYYNTPSDTNGEYSFTYSITNPLTSYTTTRTQTIKNITEYITANVNVNRTFLVNTADQAIFADNTPTIFNANVGDVYTVYLTSTFGYFGYDEPSLTSNLVITGNASTVNSIISTVKFYPLKDASGYKTYEYRQYVNNVPQFDLSPVLFGQARSTPIVGSGPFIYSTPGTTTHTLTYEQQNYLLANVTVIGAGGSGGNGAYDSGYYYGGGGGGAGGFKELAAVNFNGNANVTVNVGGFIGSNWSGPSSLRDGTNTVEWLFAHGGGWGAPYGGRGGNCVDPYHIGGYSYDSFAGGGGAGWNGNGIADVGANGGSGGPGRKSIVNADVLTSTYSAGGGGGSSNGWWPTWGVGGAGGSGVGGRGADNNGNAATAGSTFGSGGGGGYSTYRSGAGGASGAVVITFY